MKFGLDMYADLDSPIHRWDPRTKLVSLLVLIFAFAFVQNLWLLLPMVMATAVLFILSKLPFHFLLSRLKLPGFILFGLIVFLPFAAGETVLFALGPLSVKQEGLLTAVLIAVRFGCIITVSIVLFGTSTFLTSIKAMRALGLPLILTDMILLTYRYLFEISHYFSTMQTAVRLRGYRFNKNQIMHSLTTLASLIGNLLVRSYDQSERVYRAMVLRGYGYGSGKQYAFTTTRLDLVKTAVVLLIAIGIVSGQLIWGNFV